MTVQKNLRNSQQKHNMFTSNGHSFNNQLILILFVNFALLLSLGKADKQNVLYVIIGQNSSYNQGLIQDLKQTIESQYILLNLTTPQILISPEHFSNNGADWTIIPLIEPILIVNERVNEFQWVIVLEEYTNVNSVVLLNELAKYTSSNELWVGHALHDSEATIIHHFAFHENPTFFAYPHLGSGFAMTIPLLKRLHKRMQTGLKQQNQFHIDSGHEFALFVYDDGAGPIIEHNPKFCSAENLDCATYPKKFKPCGGADVSAIFFAVKTCQKFHDTRVLTVKQTWLPYVREYTFFSDFQDDQVPTVTVNVENTEQGHCQKTINILQFLDNEFLIKTNLQWVALVDDDTILSVSRLARLTNCYPNTSSPLILGERYRFGLQGFNYPTGGAGILINKAALHILALECTCLRPDSPDDMVIGACADTLKIPLIHVPQLHQARPDDYAAGRLANKDAITFHKHWMIDPALVYRKWFLEDDQKLIISNRHEDL